MLYVLLKKVKSKSPTYNTRHSEIPQYVFQGRKPKKLFGNHSADIADCGIIKLQLNAQLVSGQKSQEH